MHCNLRLPDACQSFSANYDAYAKFEIVQLIRCHLTAFLLSIHYVARWSVIAILVCDLMTLIMFHVFSYDVVYFSESLTYLFVTRNDFLMLIRYVMLWPWPLTVNLQHFGCCVFIFCTKFEWNQVIHGWVIDDEARFHHLIFKLGALSLNGFQGFVDQTSLNLWRI